mgnify:FL=1
MQEIVKEFNQHEVQFFQLNSLRRFIQQEFIIMDENEGEKSIDANDPYNLK